MVLHEPHLLVHHPVGAGVAELVGPVLDVKGQVAIYVPQMATYLKRQHFQKAAFLLIITDQINLNFESLEPLDLNFFQILGYSLNNYRILLIDLMN